MFPIVNFPLWAVTCLLPIQVGIDTDITMVIDCRSLTLYRQRRFQQEGDLVIGDQKSHLMTCLLVCVTVGICCFQLQSQLMVFKVEC
jgi:hypothetical protein